AHRNRQIFDAPHDGVFKAIQRQLRGDGSKLAADGAVVGKLGAAVFAAREMISDFLVFVGLKLAVLEGTEHEANMRAFRHHPPPSYARSFSKPRIRLRA